MELGAHIRVNEGVAGIWWCCASENIRAISPGLPSGAKSFSTYSVYYGSNCGFDILRGDATNPPSDEAWLPLRFDYDINSSSYITNAGAESTLQWIQPYQIWPHMLFPDIYLPSISERAQSYFQTSGGLRGDLPLFLALLAFSTPPDGLAQWIPAMFQQGRWKTHYNSPKGRRSFSSQRPNRDWFFFIGFHCRGVVVYVYTGPSQWGNSWTVDDLRRYENGYYGHFYY